MATLSVLISAPAAFATGVEQGFLVVDGAQDIREYQHDATYRQVSYTIHLAYSARAIGQLQWEQLRKAGWSRCQSADPGQAAANVDWVSFLDGTVTPQRVVHQHLTHWLKGNHMIMVSLRYYSATLDRSWSVVPDNQIQHVDIVFDDDPEGRDKVAWLNLDCSQ